MNKRTVDYVEFSVYALVDPRTNEARYVGRTSKDLHGRLSDHLRDKKSAAKWSWIQELFAHGLTPRIVELEHVNCERLSAYDVSIEYVWMRILDGEDEKLLNKNFGCVQITYELSDEQRKSLSAKSLKI